MTTQTPAHASSARQRQRSSGRALNVAPVLNAVPGRVWTRRSLYHMKDLLPGTEIEAQGMVNVPMFETAPARVRVTGGVTRNLGDYNSARVEVMVELPCLPEDSEIRAAYEYATALVDELIPQELAKAVGEG